MRRLLLLLTSVICGAGLSACQHAQFSSPDNANQTPWATPESWERNAGNPFGAMGGLENLQNRR